MIFNFKDYVIINNPERFGDKIITFYGPVQLMSFFLNISFVISTLMRRPYIFNFTYDTCKIIDLCSVKGDLE